MAGGGGPAEGAAEPEPAAAGAPAEATMGGGSY